jgi:hypothetical protein
VVLIGAEEGSDPPATAAAFLVGGVAAMVVIGVATAARTRAGALLCVHRAQVQGGGLHAQGVAILPAGRLRDALGQDRVLSDADVELLAAAARLRLRPAA